MKFRRYLLTAGVLLAVAPGCALSGKGENASISTANQLEDFIDPTTAASNATVEPRVLNPPAKTIRFEGQETVLGTADVAPLSTGLFCSELQDLLGQQKYYTASKLVQTRPDTAEQAFWERSLNASDDLMVGFIAEVLSEGVPPVVALNSLRTAFQLNQIDGRVYHQARTDFTRQLKSEDPSQEDAERLRIVAQRLNHPLVMIDALRLLGIKELANGRHAWAESLFLQAATIAGQNQDRVHESELWLMVAISASHSNRLSEANNAWQKATQTRVEMHQTFPRPINAGFWIRADEQRPSGAAWPDKISQTFAPQVTALGCQLNGESSPEMVLWSAVAAARYDELEHQAALLNFKKAETFATGENVMWLRIAQSKCLAGLGQSHTAAALLSSPASSENPTIAIASTAAIGSAKLQAGAHQQGVQLLSNALKDSRATDWPERSQAEADLALGLLILGETAPGLEALHAAQRTFEQKGERLSLLQALENELRLLEHEGRGEEATAILEKIRQFEQT